MSRLSLVLLCCTSSVMSMQIESQESQILKEYSNKGYPVVIKDLKEKPIIEVSHIPNELSDKLYDNKNLKENDIEQLVKQGAVLNYATPSTNYFQRPLPLYYAFGKNDQAVKNMKKIIELGGGLRHFKDENGSAVEIAVSQNHTQMIKLLMTYEDPEVAIYVEKEKLGSEEGFRISTQEAQTRENILHNSFYHQNIDGIKLLLDLKLVSPERAIREFIKFMKPNQGILNLLLSYAPNNIDNLLSAVATNAFPVEDKKVEFFTQMCTAKAFNEITLEKMHMLNKRISEIITILESNQSTPEHIIQ
jgi:hypothetical protein